MAYKLEIINDNDEITEEIFEKQIDIVKKYNGVFTVLWHNSSFDKENWDGWKNVFEYTMEYLCKNNSIALSGREIIRRFDEKVI